MPRKPRLVSPSGIYHVILRSVNQQLIFEDLSDYQKFIYILSDCKNKYGIDIYAYCIMDNHIHLLIKSNNNLASFFQSLGSRFVRWYNDKYNRFGHLFQERYFSRIVETKEYFMNTLIYIHNNPVAAKTCRFPSEYYWSSYNAYYGQTNKLVDLNYSYELAGSKEALLQYFAQKNKELDSIYESSYDVPKTIRHITDEDALEIFKKTTNLPSTFEIHNIPKARRNEIIRTLHNKSLTYSQLSRLLGVSRSTIQRICKNMSH